MPELRWTCRGVFSWKWFICKYSPKRNIPTTSLTLWGEVANGHKVIPGAARARARGRLPGALATGRLWQPVSASAGAVGWRRGACRRSGWDHAVDFVLQRAAQPVVHSTECSLLWTELELFQPTLFKESHRHRGEKTGKITLKSLKLLCSRVLAQIFWFSLFKIRNPRHYSSWKSKCW